MNKTMLKLLMIFTGGLIVFSSCNKIDLLPFRDAFKDKVLPMVPYLGIEAYVAGSDGKKAVLWKNGVATYLSSGSANGDRANSVFVKDGTVYVAGKEAGKPRVWIDGVGYYLSDSAGEALSVSVADGNVYVGGKHRIKAPSINYPGDGEQSVMSGVIWKNGTPIKHFSNYSEYSTEVTSVFASGADIYATGNTHSAGIIEDLEEPVSMIEPMDKSFARKNDVFINSSVFDWN